MDIRKKILIVEDDAFTRFMMKMIIETLEVGVDVHLASDGTSGCARLESDPETYALVLMDIHMPNLSGIEATRRIRSNTDDPPRNVPIIAVTADPDYHHPMAVQTHGMNGYMAKPISPGALIGLIEKYCGAA